MSFVQSMIEKSTQKDSDWSRDYIVGKWAIIYLDMLKREKSSQEQIEEVCRRYWSGPSVRR